MSRLLANSLALIFVITFWAIIFGLAALAPFQGSGVH